ncbi:unnamed protein product [Miscanthus lutarioriparius]|uniref:Uncharacterized protein n=1 Tax=Miscanthus lutarioriparius TaxID=422564 RepID=A0A811P2G8_9POAL|nr:unnamed protein product [Miscanthus lutarioriparius]
MASPRWGDGRSRHQGAVAAWRCMERKQAGHRLGCWRLSVLSNERPTPRTASIFLLVWRFLSSQISSFYAVDTVDSDSSIHLATTAPLIGEHAEQTFGGGRAGVCPPVCLSTSALHAGTYIYSFLDSIYLILIQITITQYMASLSLVSSPAYVAQHHEFCDCGRRVEAKQRQDGGD